MRTKTEQFQARAAEPRRRKRVRPGHRRADRALVAVTVSRRLGVPVADLVRAMRAAGVTGQVTRAQAKGWASDPGSAAPWLSVLWGERLARAAQQEHRRQQQEEERELRELAAGQAAAAKVQAGKRRFSDGGGHTRRAQVVAVDGPLSEAAYVSKSGQWRSGWFGLLALQPLPAGAP